MNKVILQLWQESNLNEENLSDGCSLHIDINERNNYVASVYKNRTNDVPNSYDKILGEYVEVFVSDSIFEMVKLEKSVKIPESAFQNMIKFEDLIYNKSEV